MRLIHDFEIVDTFHLVMLEAADAECPSQDSWGDRPTVSWFHLFQHHPHQIDHHASTDPLGERGHAQENM